ncbi:hypothetical protein HDF10_000105 [Edaphobacter lichenicola]|uniref:Uncharacterized protein n=1 Tax=Tunturiibacter lichenicola TaxID=2051959 RepID=A0A7W8N3R9_9BACT|nr:hypothetical protein [Edaphobacter lichenicola]
MLLKSGTNLVPLYHSSDNHVDRSDRIQDGIHGSTLPEQQSARLDTMRGVGLSQPAI